MDPYEKKLSEMKGYVPFLDKMISRLEKVKDGTKDQQLSKMKDLLKILTNPDKKLRLETLIKCETVLKTLYEKIEGGSLNNPPNSGISRNSKPSVHLSQDGSIDRNTSKEAKKQPPQIKAENKKRCNASSPMDQRSCHRESISKPSQNDVTSQRASSVERSSNNTSIKPRNTGPGLLPTPIVRPPFDPSHGARTPGNPNTIRSNIPNKLGHNRDRGFEGARPPIMNNSHSNNLNINRPVNDPWAVRPPPFAMLRGGPRQPNRFPSPWINQDNAISPWGQSSGFNPQGPPPNFVRPPPRQNFSDLRPPQPWLRNPPPQVNDQRTFIDNNRTDNERLLEENIVPPQFPSMHSNIIPKTDSINLPDTNKPPPWPVGNRLCPDNSDNRNRDNELPKTNTHCLPSSSLPSVPPPPPIISDVVASRVSSYNRPRSIEPEETILATPDSPEPQDMGIIDTPDSPDSSPAKYINPLSPSQNLKTSCIGNSKASSENPKVIPLERQRSQVNEQNELGTQNHERNSAAISHNSRKISFTIGQGATNKPKESTPPKSSLHHTKPAEAQYPQKFDAEDKLDIRDTPVGKGLFKPLSTIESPASPTSPTGLEYDNPHSPPTNIPTMGILGLAQKGSVLDNNLDTRNMSDLTSIPGRRALLDTPGNSTGALKTHHSSNWKVQPKSTSSEERPPSSQLDHPGSASNSPYSPYSPGQSPQQQLQTKSSSNSPSTYSPYSPGQSPQPAPCHPQHHQNFPQSMERIRPAQNNFQHPLPNIPPTKYHPNMSGERMNNPQLRGFEPSGGNLSPSQNIPHKKNPRLPQPDHRNSMNMFAQHRPQGHTVPQFPQQPNMRPRKPMTYGEYRKWKEEQRRKEEAHMNAEQMSNPTRGVEFASADKPDLTAKILPPTQRNTDPRRRPTVLASEQAAKRVNSEEPEETKESNKSLSSFKIPKKKKSDASSVPNQSNRDQGDNAKPSNVCDRKGASMKTGVSYAHDEGREHGQDSGSDSEPELKIAEHEIGSDSSDHDTPISESKMQDVSDEFGKLQSLKQNDAKKSIHSVLTKDNIIKSTHSTEVERSEKTGGFLQTIVSSLAPSDAEKLLRKANTLKNPENITLKQLKLLLADDSDGEDDPTEKEGTDATTNNTIVTEDIASKDKSNVKETRGKKTKTVAKTRQAPTPGVRKSRRLMHSENSSDAPSTSEKDPEEENTVIDDSDDDDNQLVIDEETPTKDTNSSEHLKRIEHSPFNVVTVDFTNAVDNIEDHTNAVDISSLSSETSSTVKPKSVKRGRGRPRRLTNSSESEKPTVSHEVVENMTVECSNKRTRQDSAVSSNSDNEINSKSKEDQNDIGITKDVESDSFTKIQIKNEHEDERLLNSELVKTEVETKKPVPSQMRKTKMKTWFPGERDSRTNLGIFKKRRKTIMSPEHEINDSITVKKEPKEADLKVFVGKEVEAKEELFSTTTELDRLLNGGDLLKEICLEKTDCDVLKSRVVKMRGIAHKMRHLREGQDSVDSSEDDSTLKKQNERKIKRLKQGDPSNGIKDSEDIDTSVVITEKPSLYIDGLSCVISSLQTKVVDHTSSKETLSSNIGSSQGELDNLCSDKIDEAPLLNIVKSMKKESTVIKEKEDPVTSCHKDNSFITEQELSSCHDQELLRIVDPIKTIWERDFKNEEAWMELSKPVSLKHLFKCMVQSACTFTSDNAAKFRMHLEEHSLSKRRDRHGWLHCAYCIKKWSSVDCLISHIIKCHGNCEYQCGYCFYRQKTRIDLIFHQHNYHTDMPKKIISCKSMNVPLVQKVPTRVSYKPYKCRDPNCTYRAPSISSLSNHLYLEHKDMTSSTDYQCMHCHKTFQTSAGLVLHSKAKHTTKSVFINVRHARTREDLQMDESELMSYLDDDDSIDNEKIGNINITEMPSACSKDESDTKTDESSTSANLLNSTNMEKGFTGVNLYRCGNHNCSFKAGNVLSFKFHLTSCSYSKLSTFFTCFHCAKQFKHAPTLLEHLKSHGLKRYLCSLCNSYRSSLPINVKTHMRNEHKSANNYKLVSLNGGSQLNNPEEEMFLVVPKNCLPRGALTQKSAKGKDTFSPNEISSIPPRSMTRMVLRCSVCDFGTKVRHNLVKHLKLHLRATSVGGYMEEETKRIDRDDDFIVPIITPINAPTKDDHPEKGRMTNLLASVDDPEHQVLSEEDLKKLPSFVEENKRFACSHYDCSYSTLDEMMLLSHIQALHPDVTSYVCPHCKNENKSESSGCSLDLEDLEFHLKCHGELLFKCCYCSFYHWQKRTAEKHVKDTHTTKNVSVRDVRKDSIARAAMKNNNNEGNDKEGKEGPEKLVLREQTDITYRPFRCGICEHAQITQDGILEHIRESHSGIQQPLKFKCLFCNETSNDKVVIRRHFESSHSDVESYILECSAIQLYFIDPYNVSSTNTGMSIVHANENVEMEEKREPLWKRDMPGLKHIRGILYEEYSSLGIPAPPASTPKPRLVNKKNLKVEDAKPQNTINPVNVPVGTSEDLNKSIDDLADNFPMKCMECSLPKKTIKGLKMHIKLMHLRTGKFLCQKCEFSANILSSINTHYKIKHPDAEVADFEEKKEETKSFSQEYWKGNWLIPTLEERKKWVEDKANVQVATPKIGIETSASNTKTKLKKKRGRNVTSDGTDNLFPVPPKRGRKSQKIKSKQILLADKITGNREETNATPYDMVSTESVAGSSSNALSSKSNIGASTGAIMQSIATSGVQTTTTDTIAVQETSLFEQTPTYKCQYCPKRTQNLERIERHLKAEHSERAVLLRSGNIEENDQNKDSQSLKDQVNPIGYKILSRDQVVDMLTLRAPAPSSSLDPSSQTFSDDVPVHLNLQSDYICFYCDDVVGTIYELKSHFTAEHGDNSTHDRLKVKKLIIDGNKKVVNGYLECQVCGYLSGGFDRTKQRIHFHDEHPLEEVVNVSKYVLKEKNLISTTGIAPEIQNRPTSSTNKFDPSKFVGMTIYCPKSVEMHGRGNQLSYHPERCNFETKSIATMNSHLKKHTSTYKCGHCGKTHLNASDFHRHTAMSHGNKIPDLVKDLEAHANFQALKGLVEANLQITLDREAASKNESTKEIVTTVDPKDTIESIPTSTAAPSRLVARKSTGGIKRPKKEHVPGGENKTLDSIAPEMENDFSYYGSTPEPINLSTINTQMSMGGIPIVLNVAKMSEIVNIHPRLALKDCMSRKEEETEEL